MTNLALIYALKCFACLNLALSLITKQENKTKKNKLRLGAQSFTLLITLRDPMQLRRRQWATRQQHLFFGCTLLSSLEQLISAPNHE